MSCPLAGAVAPPTSGHLLDWPPSLNLPTSPNVPEVGPPSNKGESLSPWSTSAPGKLMAQWLASDLPISPHLGWLQPSSDRHNFMLLGQQVSCPDHLHAWPDRLPPHAQVLRSLWTLSSYAYLITYHPGC